MVARLRLVEDLKKLDFVSYCDSMVVVEPCLQFRFTSKALDLYLHASEVASRDGPQCVLIWIYLILELRLFSFPSVRLQRRLKAMSPKSTFLPLGHERAASPRRPSLELGWVHSEHLHWLPVNLAEGHLRRNLPAPQVMTSWG